MKCVRMKCVRKWHGSLRDGCDELSQIIQCHGQPSDEILDRGKDTASYFCEQVDGEHRWRFKTPSEYEEETDFQAQTFTSIRLDDVDWMRAPLRVHWRTMLSASQALMSTGGMAALQDCRAPGNRSGPPEQQETREQKQSSRTAGVCPSQVHRGVLQQKQSPWTAENSGVRRSMLADLANGMKTPNVPKRYRRQKQSS
ncbi:hypothetical protein D4764_08G0000850 [Takifugu flavidus]|uniref:Uncharacterized protein n=1 Tax=Takifugu flavidus TaxID=433684 RepID=A0A5C6MNH5_9TELE|nr:hypothetical protein D4764_08G0000850 [Takifugu flavidus]